MIPPRSVRRVRVDGRDARGRGMPTT